MCNNIDKIKTVERSQWIKCPLGIRPSKDSSAYLCPLGPVGAPPNCINCPVCLCALSHCLVTHRGDTSAIYHNIRGQFVIVWYVGFNVLGILDHLCSPLGVNMLEFSVWTIASAVVFLNRCSGPSHSSGISVAQQAVVLLFCRPFDYVFRLIYVVVYTMILLTCWQTWVA